jgi:hypothetical protein
MGLHYSQEYSIFSRRICIIDNKGGRRAELVAVNGSVEILEISLAAIESHPQSQQIWKKFARLLCIKVR